MKNAKEMNKTKATPHPDPLPDRGGEGELNGTERSNGTAATNEPIAGSRKRPPLARMMKIYEVLQEGKYPNCSTLAAELDVAAKTVRRDIDFMRDERGLPIEYDPQRFGYYFTRPVERFPEVPVTEKELFALCVAQKAIEQYHGTAFQQPLELAFQKCMGQLDDRERFTLQNLDEVLSFRPFAPEDADLRLFELVTQAVRERRVLQFEYRKPGEKCADARRVQPYHLMQFSNRWYLIAHDLKTGPQPRMDANGHGFSGPQKSTKEATRKEGKEATPHPIPLPGRGGEGERNTGGTHCATTIRKFVLGRMRATALTAETFTVPADFNAKEFFGRSFGVMTGAGDYEVVIAMDAWLTDVLRGRRWHPTQVWTELPGRGSQLRMRLSCLEEIEQWVLSWGTHATVVRPQALVERVMGTVRVLAERYAVGANSQWQMGNRQAA